MLVPNLDIHFTLGGPALAIKHADQLAELYERDFVDPPLRGTHFYSKKRFLEMLFEDYVQAPHYQIMLAMSGSEIVGFVYGCSLPSGTKWWEDVKEDLPASFTHEDAKRTLALIDILVTRKLRGSGLGRALHDKFLAARKEERVSLMSSPSQQPAHTIWQHWGYQKVGTAEPAHDGTVLDVFIREK